MNERYLFRGKSVEYGVLITGSYVDAWEEIIDDVGYGYDIDPTTLGQCTGLKDENGTLIFEGDIVTAYLKYENDELKIQALRVVKWNECAAGFCLEDVKGEIICPMNNYVNIEVIGNIHDNGDLLCG